MTLTEDLDAFFSAASLMLKQGVEHSVTTAVTVAFDLTGPGGGQWTLYWGADDVRIHREQVEQPDCRMTISVADFGSVVDGELNHIEGYTSGKIKIEGDVGLVLLLAQLFHGQEGR